MLVWATAWGPFTQLLGQTKHLLQRAWPWTFSHPRTDPDFAELTW